MGEIRSAWEMALERTKDIKSDPQAVKAHEAKNRGKRLVAKLLDDPDFDLKKALKQEPKEEIKWVKEGLFSIIQSSIILPKGNADLTRFDQLAEILGSVASDRRAIQNTTSQIRQFLSQYLEDRNQVIEYLRQQYSSRLRQREEQLSQQYGTPVKLDPSSDPEFSNAIQDNLSKLDRQYQDGLTQAKQHLEQLFQSTIR